MDKLQSNIAPFLDMISAEPWLQSIVVIAVTLLLARLVTVIVLGALRFLVGRTRSSLDDEILGALSTPLVFTLVMVGLLIAVRIMPLDESFKHILGGLLRTLGIIVWARFFIQLVKLLMHRAAARADKFQLLQHATLPLFENVAFVVIIALAVYLIFDTWGIDMTAWLASAGIIGIAVGFAAKDTLANLFSGVFILTDMPYKIGDYVVLDSGERGRVTQIGIRSTRLLTRDDVELTIPNSIMGNSKIINQSGGPYKKFRIRVPVGAAYGSDIDQVKNVLLEIGQQNEMTCDEPEPRVRFRALGASSLDFELLCWVNDPALRGRAMDALLSEIYKRFNAEGIEIPYSKQDIYIKELPDMPGSKKV